MGRRQVAFVLKLFDSGVTIVALKLRVNGFGKKIRWKEQRNLFAINVPCCCWVSMAVETILGRYYLSRGAADQT